MERWKPVVGFEDYYEVSDQGRVKSLSRFRVTRPGRGYQQAERILVPVAARTRLDGKSRLIVTLHGSDGPRWTRVPHIVLGAFIGPRPSAAHQARHLDCDPTNNRAANLLWGTAAENHADTLRCDHIYRGEDHPGAKLTDAQITEIRALRAAGVSGLRLAARFGVSHRLIYLIEQRKAWSHVAT
jgi:hypothetical protein